MIFILMFGRLHELVSDCTALQDQEAIRSRTDALRHSCSETLRRKAHW